MISESDGCAGRPGELKETQLRRVRRGCVGGGGDGVTEGFICQPSDTGVLWLNIFSPCHSRIRNHHKVGEHEYCP